MRALMIVLATGCLTISSMAQTPTGFTTIGEYSTMRFTEEHAYGYSVQIWRDGDSIVGLFFAADGLAGDTPAGRLENVVFRPATGELSFQSRLSMSVVLKPDGSQQPSRERFEFTGKLSPAALVGTLKRYDVLQSARPPKVERITFRPLRNRDLFGAQTKTEWEGKASEILKRRGPKW